MASIENIITENIDIWSLATEAKKGVGRGNRKKLNLYGIKKLRELILELAFKGLLVPQDLSDEPASVLLEKITKEKELLVKDKKIKKTKVQPEIGDKEKSFAQPTNWEWVRFGNIAQHNSGKTLDKGRNRGKSRKYLTTSNLYWGIFKLENIREMLIKDEELEKCSVRKDDLLICEGGDAGRAAVWEKDEEICFQNHIHRARFYGKLNPYYMYRFFEKLTATGEINKYRKGVGISNMSGKSLSSIILPLPPLAEQDRIVAKVDELMTLCDKLEQQQENSITAHKTLVETLLSALTNAADKGAFDEVWEKIANHFDTLFTTEHSIDLLKQTIQQLAVMGKLLPHDRNNETATVLLNRLSLEKEELIQSKNIKKSKNIEPVNDEVPFKLPSSWQWTRLDTIGKFFEYGTSTKAHEDPDGVPVLRMGNIQNGEIVYKNLKYVDSDIDELPRLYLQHGDLVFNRTNSYELVGKMGVFDGADDNYTLASYLIRVKLFNKYIEPRFINMFFQTPVCRTTQIEPEITVQTNQANFNGTKLKNIVVPIAPLEEQKKIIEKVDELMSLCEQFRKRIGEVKITQLHLADAMLEKAIN